MFTIKALVIGAAGFVGNYLLREIEETLACEIVATKMHSSAKFSKNIKTEYLDILKYETIVSLLKETRPSFIFHLAAQSSVALAWKDPVSTANTNVLGSLNVLNAIRQLDYSPKVLMVGSGEEYGNVEKMPIDECTIPNPGNIYAATKVCQNMIARVFCKAYDMKIVLVRAFNHIGPGQKSTFVVSDFCNQVAKIEKGIQEPIIKVGSLNIKRDFTDVRDVVSAYVKLIQFGKVGETYNVGQGRSFLILDILEKILSYSKCKIKIEIDEKKLRPIDIPIIEPDIKKIYVATGWEPKIPLEKSIEDILDYWRDNI